MFITKPIICTTFRPIVNLFSDFIKPLYKPVRLCYSQKTLHKMKILYCVALSSVLVSTCWCACEIKWIRDEHIEQLPNGAFLATPANNPSGEFYVARANVEGALTPGRFNFKERQFFYTMDGKEHGIRENFEVLTNPNNCNLNWRRAFGGTFPKGSIAVGVDKKGVSVGYLVNVFLRLIDEYIIWLDPPRPAPHPHSQPQTHRAAYRALAHGPQPREPQPR